MTYSESSALKRYSISVFFKKLRNESYRCVRSVLVYMSEERNSLVSYLMQYQYVSFVRD